MNPKSEQSNQKIKVNQRKRDHLINDEDPQINEVQRDSDRKLEEEKEEEARKIEEQQKDDVKSFYSSKPEHQAKAPCLLSVNDQRKTYWDLFVMFLAAFNVFIIPLDVGFNPESFQSTYFKILNSSIDFLFLLDIILAFRTTFINENTGAEVTDAKTIARQYLRGQFTIDMLATVPFDTLGQLLFSSDNVTFKIFGALKLVRVLRLSKIITYLRSSEEFKAFLKLNKLLFFLAIYLHCFGSIWWMIVSYDQ